MLGGGGRGGGTLVTLIEGGRGGGLADGLGECWGLGADWSTWYAPLGALGGRAGREGGRVTSVEPPD